MLALECFEDRWNIPKAYHLFYDQFFKAAVGDRRWKKNIEEDESLGNANTEAFALMILKNNYHAWLAQAYSEFTFENQYNMELQERKRRQEQGNDNTDEEDEEFVGTSILDEILPNFHYYKNDQPPRVEPKNKKKKRNHCEVAEDAGAGIGVIASAAAKRQLLKSYDDEEEDENENDQLQIAHKMKEYRLLGQL